jgi:hypothetical protein
MCFVRELLPLIDEHGLSQFTSRNIREMRFHLIRSVQLRRTFWQVLQDKKNQNKLSHVVIVCDILHFIFIFFHFICFVSNCMRKLVIYFDVEFQNSLLIPNFWSLVLAFLVYILFLFVCSHFHVLTFYLLQIIQIFRWEEIQNNGFSGR